MHHLLWSSAHAYEIGPLPAPVADEGTGPQGSFDSCGLYAAVSGRTGIRTTPDPRFRKGGKCSDPFGFLKVLEVSGQGRDHTEAVASSIWACHYPEDPRSVK